MHDLILEIDGILWWAVIAFAILAVVLFFLVKESDVKREPRTSTDHTVTHQGVYKPTETSRKATSVPVDSAAISDYRSAKLRSCMREIKMLEQLNLVKGSRVIPEPTQRQPETKRDNGDKKRGIWD